MNYSYQQNKKGKVGAWILATILLIAAAGAVFVVFNKKGNENSDKSATNTQEGLVMMAEPDFRLNAPIGLRSTAIITPELYTEVSEDENKNFGIVFAPLNYFLKVDMAGVVITKKIIVNN